MILVDTSVWIDYFKGVITAQTERLDSLLGREPLAIGDLILAEVLQGFDHDRDFHQARKMLVSLEVVELGGRKSPSAPRRISGRCAAAALPFAKRSTP